MLFTVFGTLPYGKNIAYALGQLLRRRRNIFTYNIYIYIYINESFVYPRAEYIKNKFSVKTKFSITSIMSDAKNKTFQTRKT